MAVKYFCDECGKEITEANRVTGATTPGRLGVARGASSHLSVEVITICDGTFNDGVFCKYCVIDKVNEADDRTVEMPRVPPTADQVRAYNFTELEALVQRFLGWEVPQTACADLCASDPTYRDRWPTSPRSGTNFFSAEEAKLMLIHVLQLEPNRG